MYRPHPISLYYDIKKWIWLLLLPILRSLLRFQNAQSIILSSIRDIAIGLLLVFYSYVRWRYSRYSLSDGLSVKRGLIWRREQNVMAGDAASVEVECTPLMWLTRGRRVRVNTAGLRKRADATVYLPASAIQNYSPPSSRHCRRYASRVLPVIVLSASSSNAALGFLALAPLIRQAGNFIGREISGEVYGLVNRLIALGLPPLLNFAANLLILGWLFSFIRTFARTAGFYSERQGQRLHILSGMLTRRDTYIDCKRITTLELRQTLFMRLFRLYSVIITAAGYGREKGARPIIVPVAHPHELRQALHLLLPEYPISPVSIRPFKTSVITYILLPLLFTLGSILPFIQSGVFSLIAVLWLIVGLWWLGIRIAGFLRSGFGVGPHAVTMRYAHGLALYEIHIPNEVADCFIILQNPLQKWFGTCTVELRSFGEKRRRHRVPSLPYELSKKLIEQTLNHTNSK